MGRLSALRLFAAGIAPAEQIFAGLAMAACIGIWALLRRRQISSDAWDRLSRAAGRSLGGVGLHVIELGVLGLALLGVSAGVIGVVGAFLK